MNRLVSISALTILGCLCCPDANAQFNTISAGIKPKVLTRDVTQKENSPSEPLKTAPKDSAVSATNSRDALYERYLSVSYPLKEIQVNSPFGMRKHPVTKKYAQHNGLDLKAQYECVYSILPGEVVRVGQDNISGKFVTIQSANYTVSYCHLAQTYAQTGAIVKAGEVIALSGNTGRSTAPHLHLTIKKDGKAFNPTILLNFVRSIRESCIQELMQ